MSQQSIVTKNPKRDQQLRNELPGDWYNYEPKDTALDAGQVNHWLDQPDEYLRLLSSHSRA
jgi:hypothetical protein